MNSLSAMALKACKAQKRSSPRRMKQTERSTPVWHPLCPTPTPRRCRWLGRSWPTKRTGRTISRDSVSRRCGAYVKQSNLDGGRLCVTRCSPQRTRRPTVQPATTGGRPLRGADVNAQLLARSR
jgi:hypothetical protein